MLYRAFLFCAAQGDLTRMAAELSSVRGHMEHRVAEQLDKIKVIDKATGKLSTENYQPACCVYITSANFVIFLHRFIQQIILLSLNCSLCA